MSRILVVDDELPVLCGLSRALPELCNFFGEVRTVVNGREALHEVINCFYKVCFLDIKLPDINGLNVLKDIKDISPETNVILMSASPASNEVKSLIKNRTAHYISKPFDFEQIRDLIKLTFDEPGQYCEADSDPDTQEKRRHQRDRISRSVSFYVKGVNVKELAGAVNISCEGLCIETYYPLTKGEILIFEKGAPGKRGVVVWSAINHNDNYRGGIRFL